MFPVHGGWSEWSPWGPCSTTCGRGYRRRFRTCDDPLPSHGGRTCPGSDQDVRRCPSRPCQEFGSVRGTRGGPQIQELTDEHAEQEFRVKSTGFAEAVVCAHGYERGNSSCVDVDECLDDSRCQHKCQNLPGSFECLCPMGYRIATDGISCQDIDECQENNIDCETDYVCSNGRGSYQCIYAPCPPEYIRDKLGSSCWLNCDENGASCQPKTQFADVLTYKTAALPSGVHRGKDIVRLTARDHDAALLTNSFWSILSASPDVPFDVRVDRGAGVVFATRDLPPGTRYRVTVHSSMRDDANATVLFTTRFFLFVSTAMYPY